MKIPIINPTTTLSEKTWLTVDYTSGTALTVKNTTGYADNDLILVGDPGQELTEITDLTATPPSTTSFTVTALNFAHGKDTQVCKVQFDQAEIYKSTNAVDYTLITTIDLQYDKMITVYDYLAGATTDSYKIRLKNSVTANVSAYSDVQLGSGWTRKSAGRMVRNIRGYLKDLENRLFEDWQILSEIKNASDEVISEIPNAYFTLRSSARTTTASTCKYYLPTDYRAMLFLLYTYAPSVTEQKKYPLRYKPKDEFVRLAQDQTADDDDYLAAWTETPGDDTYPNGYFETYPTPESDGKAMTLWYFREEPDFDSFGDLTSCPLPQVIEHRVISIMSPDEDIRNQHEKLYKQGLIQLKVRQRREFSPRALMRWVGVDAINNMYGRGAVGRTSSDVENYW